jgi:hypothetical protein
LSLDYWRGSVTPTALEFQKLSTRWDSWGPDTIPNQQLNLQQVELVEQMTSQFESVSTDEYVEEAAWLPVREAHVESQGDLVEADKFAAEAVLQGAHLYAKGVRRCHGLKAGRRVAVVDERGNLAGAGVARQGETAILTYRQGLAVEVTKNRFGIPASWPQNGMRRDRYTYSPCQRCWLAKY